MERPIVHLMVTVDHHLRPGEGGTWRISTR